MDAVLLRDYARERLSLAAAEGETMTLVEEIIEGASGNTMDLATLLRRCKVLVARVGSKPAEEWLDRELDGYPDEVEVPRYRVLPMQLQGDFIGDFHRANDYVIPPALVPERAREGVQQSEYRRSVSTVEHLAKAESGLVSVPMGNLALVLNRKVFPDMQCVAVRGIIGTASLIDILNSVRNRVLKFSLELWKETPDAGMPGKKPSDARAQQIITNVIYGNANVVGTAHNSHVILNVQGDFASLKQVLEESGVSAQDIAELKAAVDAERKTEKGQFGVRVTAWIGKMVGKAADGSWKVATSAAGGLLSKAIGKYYGIE